MAAILYHQRQWQRWWRSEEHEIREVRSDYYFRGNLSFYEIILKIERFEPFDVRDTWGCLQEAKKGDIEKKLDYLEQRLNIEIGNLKLSDVYNEAINYPYRPGAVKAVVTVLATPCEKSPLPISVSFYSWSLSSYQRVLKYYKFSNNFTDKLSSCNYNL